MDKLGLISFLEIIDCGSLTAAAARLHSTPPTISRRIQELERTLGARLFDRDHRNLRPTEAGRCFVPHAHQILATMDQAKLRVASTMEQLQKMKDSGHSGSNST